MSAQVACDQSLPQQRDQVNESSQSALMTPLMIIDALVRVASQGQAPSAQLLAQAKQVLRGTFESESSAETQADPLGGVSPELAMAIGQLSMAMDSPTVYGRGGDLFTPVVLLAAERIKQLKEPGKHLREAVDARVRRTGSTCTLELEFRCHGMAKLAEEQLKHLTSKA